ncbi:unnamed protein product [Taenia asiatica]|uniref:Fibronectin type-III domain-containing protein n=1 Tax=Taenia asiatica TaxID=60517 RepID=A0A0R3VT09_TAEAS|nr:unnamed protein product [Taenia asiatica]
MHYFKSLSILDQQCPYYAFHRSVNDKRAARGKIPASAILQMELHCELGEDYADTISLTAVGISYQYIDMNFTDFKDGKLILEGLRPCSLYFMNVKVVRLFKYVHAYGQFIITASKGWDVAALPEEYAEVVILTAGANSYLFFRMNYTAYSDGSLTLRGLQPETKYNVTAELVRPGKDVLSYSQVITTRAKGYRDAGYAPSDHHSRLPDDDVPLHL